MGSEFGQLTAWATKRRDKPYSTPKIGGVRDELAIRRPVGLDVLSPIRCDLHLAPFGCELPHDNFVPFATVGGVCDGCAVGREGRVIVRQSGRGGDLDRISRPIVIETRSLTKNRKSHYQPKD